MNRKAQPAYETRINSLQHKTVGASEFRIHTWFDYQRNTFVVDVLTADEAAPAPQMARAAASSNR